MYAKKYENKELTSCEHITYVINDVLKLKPNDDLKYTEEELKKAFENAESKNKKIIRETYGIAKRENFKFPNPKVYKYEFDEDAGDGAWGANEENEEIVENQGGDEEGDGWGDEDLGDELDEALKALPAGSATQSAKGKLAPVSQGVPQSTRWNKGQLAADHFAAGYCESAMRLLASQISLKNAKPLRELAIDNFIGARCAYPTPIPLQPRIGFIERAPGHPALPQEESPMSALVASLKECYTLFTKGRFNDAQSKFRELLHSILFVNVTEENDANELKALIGVCREYILGLNMELERRELSTQKKDGARQVELAAYFTHCNLQGPHHLLTLRSAANCAFQHKELQTAHSLATRLLELNPKAEVANFAEKILRVSVNGQDADSLRYDSLNPFVICGAEHIPIYQGSQSIKCGFCEAHFCPSHEG